MARFGEDRGAVGAVVAIVLASGVLLGFGALVIDVGQIYVEKQELQTGADAAALAVAKACSLHVTACATAVNLSALAQQYADANSGDGVSKIEAVCGRMPGLLFPCPAPAGNLTDCLGDEPAEPTPFVEVRLATALPDGRLVLPPVFAATMAGNSGFDGASVGACARASWEDAAQIVVPALSISTCEFDDATGAGTSYAPAPPYPPDPSPADEFTIQLLLDAHPDCVGSPPGWSPAGPAMYLAGGGADCIAAMPGDALVTGLASVRDPPAGCVDRLRQAIEQREVVYLPVHDGADLANLTLHVGYLAPFVVTGFAIDLSRPDGAEKSWLSSPPGFPCGGQQQRCVSGVFVGAPLPVADLASGAIVKLIG